MELRLKEFLNALKKLPYSAENLRGNGVPIVFSKDLILKTVKNNIKFQEFYSELITKRLHTEYNYENIESHGYLRYHKSRLSKIIKSDISPQELNDRLITKSARKFYSYEDLDLALSTDINCIAFYEEPLQKLVRNVQTVKDNFSLQQFCVEVITKIIEANGNYEKLESATFIPDDHKEQLKNEQLKHYILALCGELTVKQLEIQSDFGPVTFYLRRIIGDAEHRSLKKMKEFNKILKKFPIEAQLFHDKTLTADFIIEISKIQDQETKDLIREFCELTKEVAVKPEDSFEMKLFKNDPKYYLLYLNSEVQNKDFTEYLSDLLSRCKTAQNLELFNNVIEIFTKHPDEARTFAQTDNLALMLLERLKTMSEISNGERFETEMNNISSYLSDVIALGGGSHDASSELAE